MHDSDVERSVPARPASTASPQTNLHEERQLDLLEQRMLAAFSPPLSSGDVCRAMTRARAEFESARVRLYAPLLVGRTVREERVTLVRAFDRQRSTVVQFEFVPSTAADRSLTSTR
jgi:hypothetical protein